MLPHVWPGYRASRFLLKTLSGLAFAWACYSCLSSHEFDGIYQDEGEILFKKKR